MIPKSAECRSAYPILKNQRISRKTMDFLRGTRYGFVRFVII